MYEIVIIIVLSIIGKPLSQDSQKDNLIIHVGQDWLVTMKAGPYSDKDLMIIYI